MNIEDIEKFLDNNQSSQNEYVKITFKKREAVYGLFIKGHRDFKELKSKNFWRIVLRSQFENYKKSKNIDLARIFSGSEFSRLSSYTESFTEKA